jgi:hypothetical protein
MTKSQTTKSDKSSARYVPEACPICQDVPTPPTASVPRGEPRPTAAEVLRGHLETHRPTNPCRHSHPTGQEHQTWVLDWDLVMYPRANLSCWYCRPCGHYAPQG